MVTVRTDGRFKYRNQIGINSYRSVSSDGELHFFQEIHIKLRLRYFRTTKYFNSKDGNQRPVLVENWFSVDQFLGIVSLPVYQSRLSVRALSLQSDDFSLCVSGGKQWIWITFIFIA